MLQKTCNKCQQIKDVVFFPNDKGAPDGKYRMCKACSKDANKRWYEENKAKVIARVQKSRQNPAVYQAQLESNKLWRLNHPGEASANNKRSQARAKGATVLTLTHEEWQDLLRIAKHKCTYCHEPFTETNPAQQDHIIPLSTGGQHTKANVAPSCRTCNRRKGNKPLHEFLATPVPQDLG